MAQSFLETGVGNHYTHSPQLLLRTCSHPAPRAQGLVICRSTKSLCSHHGTWGGLSWVCQGRGVSASPLHTEEITPLLRREDKVVPQPCCPLTPPSKDVCTTRGISNNTHCPALRHSQCRCRAELVFLWDLSTTRKLSLEKRQEWALFGCA